MTSVDGVKRLGKSPADPIFQCLKLCIVCLASSAIWGVSFLFRIPLLEMLARWQIFLLEAKYPVLFISLHVDIQGRELEIICPIQTGRSSSLRPHHIVFHFLSIRKGRLQLFSSDSMDSQRRESKITVIGIFHAWRFLCLGGDVGDTNQAPPSTSVALYILC